MVRQFLPAGSRLHVLGVGCGTYRGLGVALARAGGGRFVEGYGSVERLADALRFPGGPVGTRAAGAIVGPSLAAQDDLDRLRLAFRRDPATLEEMQRIALEAGLLGPAVSLFAESDRPVVRPGEERLVGIVPVGRERPLGQDHDAVSLRDWQAREEARRLRERERERRRRKLRRQREASHRQRSRCRS